MNKLSKNILFGFFLFLFLFFKNVTSQINFYNLNTIQTLEIYFSQPNWDYQMDTAKIGLEGYILADSARVNGIFYDSVGVKYKGNSSYNPTSNKNPLHIALDQFKNQSYQGFKDIKLSNCYADPTMIREVLSYDILSNYMDCPKSNFIKVYINNAYIGIYTNTESIGKTFCANHFYSSQNTFIKCNPIINPGPTTKSNLKYITSGDSSAYNNYYEIKSLTGWNELVKLCDTVTNNASALANVMDVDRAIWMLAFNNELVNLDSYTGAFCQNYYLYKDNNQRFNPIVWDLNMSFGGFPYVGAGNTSMGTLTVTNMEQLSPSIHSTDVYWPLIKDVLGNAMYKRMYIAHMRTINNEMFASSLFQAKALAMQALIDSAVLVDSNKFFTYTQFQNGMNASVPFGSTIIPGISNLMSSRLNYLGSLNDFLAVPPTISSITASNLFPALQSSVTITASVVNANSNNVYFGYRFNIQDKFVSVLMFDDGLHNDGAAGDNIYGVTFNMASGLVQYYLYAENATAGIFSPERAEHEFYTLQAGVPSANLGEVVVNEFLANNTSVNMNEYGQYEDWIELYNTTATPLNLFGLYLTDDYTIPTKFAFLQNTIIPANGYLIVWADQNASTASYVHANFKLLTTGEKLMLSNSTGVVFDSISFGLQDTNIAYGRCANGIGNFTTMSPSFAYANCLTSIFEGKANESEVSMFPNPASNNVTLLFNSKENIKLIRVYNSMGQEVFNKICNSFYETINVASFTSGIYSIIINNKQVKKLIIN